MSPVARARAVAGAQRFFAAERPTRRAPARRSPHPASRRSVDARILGTLLVEIARLSTRLARLGDTIVASRREHRQLTARARRESPAQPRMARPGPANRAR